MVINVLQRQGPYGPMKRFETFSLYQTKSNIAENDHFHPLLQKL